MTIVAALAVACAASACRAGDSTSEPQTFAIEIRDPSPDRVEMRAPQSVDAGLVQIELRNRGDMLHDAQLLRVEGDRSSADVVGVLESSDSAAKPDWLRPAGGIAATKPGETAAVTQVLAPGTYYVVDTQERTRPDGVFRTNATKGGIIRLEVEGETENKLPPTRARIVARERGYGIHGITARVDRIAFRNADDDLHQAVAFRIADGVAYREGLRRVLTREGDTGWVPIDVPHDRATPVLDGGDVQISSLRLEPGRYALLCFVSRRAGGPQQWRTGMISKLVVPPS